MERRREHFQKPEVVANPIHLLLKQTTDGRSILKFYEKTGRLRKNLRNLLSRLIVGREKDRQLAGLFDEVEQVERFRISKELFITWSEDIEKLFPGETKLIFYKPYTSVPVKVHGLDGNTVIKRRKLNARGTLHEHYDYLVRKLKEQKLFVRPDQGPRIAEEPPHGANEDQQHAADWLTTHVGPPDTVQDLWNIAHPTRQRLLKDNITVHEYFRRFPALKAALGTELLSCDFRVLFPVGGRDFRARWNIGRGVIIEALADCSGLKSEDLGYYKALPALPQHNQDSVILHLLPYLISSPRNRNQVGKISIKEKQESFLIHARAPADIDAALESQRQVCVATGSTLQPVPVIVGPIANPEGFYVYINDSVENPTIYQAATILEALTLTVKVVFALNCSYPARAEALWIFIQRAFLDIEVPTDRLSRNTTALIATISQKSASINENIDPNIPIRT